MEIIKKNVICDYCLALAYGFIFRFFLCSFYLGFGTFLSKLPTIFPAGL